MKAGDNSEAALILDPEESELPSLVGGGCFAFMFSSILAGGSTTASGEPPCSLLWTNYATAGPFDVKELASARALAQDGAREIWVALRESVGSMGSAKPFVKEMKGEEPSQPAGTMDVDDEKVEI